MGMISYMGVYKIAFFLTLLIAETQFMRGVKRRLFPLRLLAGITGFFLLSRVYPDVPRTVPLSIMFSSFAGYLILMTRFCWELD